MAVPQSPSIKGARVPCTALASTDSGRLRRKGRNQLDVFCGINWAEDHHDVALVDRDGGLLARLRITDDAAGLARLLELLDSHGDSPEGPVPVAIESPRGLLVACRRATGRSIYAVNPMAVARYRDRHPAAGRKSDHGDAVVLANVLRTDMHAHRPLPAGSELAQAVAVLARAQQDAVWDRTTAHNRLRSRLRERASGKTRSVTRRHVKNNRLTAVGYIWAFSAITASPGARVHYDRRRNVGDRHAAAQRNLFSRLLGCLHHCLLRRSV
jgi:hypothetical protein